MDILRKQQSSAIIAVTQVDLAVTAPAASSKGMSVLSRPQTSSPALPKLFQCCNACVLARVSEEFTQSQGAEFMLASLAQHMTLSFSASHLCSQAPSLQPSPAVLTPEAGSTGGIATPTKGNDSGKTHGKPVLQSTR